MRSHKELSAAARERTGRLASFGAALAVAGCAVVTPPVSPPSAAELAPLEARHTADASDVDVATRLALGHVAQGRIEAGRDVLERTSELFPSDPALSLMLGLVEEQLGSDDRAAMYFSTYLSAAGGPLTTDVRARLDATRGGAFRAAARRLLAGDSIAPTAGDDALVVVVPVDVGGREGSESHGLTWLLAESVADRDLSVVDRAWTRALLDEMGTTPDAMADLAVGVRLARLTGATHVVQVAVRPEEGGAVRWTPIVTTLLDDGTIAVLPLTATTAVADQPVMAARVAAAARASIDGEDFRSLDAAAPNEATLPGLAILQALGVGLAAVDADDWGSARSAFETAVSSDPEYEAARAWLARSQSVLRVQAEPALDALVTAAREGERRRAVVGLRQGPASVHAEALDRVARGERAALAEALGLDHIGGGTLVL